LLERLQKDGIKANVIMVSTLTSKDAEVTIMALERGAIDFVAKPTNIIEAKGEDFKNRLLSVLSAVLKTRRPVRPAEHSAVSHTMASAKPSRSSVVPRNLSTAVIESKPKVPVRRLKAHNVRNRLVALACSTGGPKALQEVIPYLSKNLDAPMVLVQHMPVGFTKSMAQRLDELSRISVKEAEEGDVLEKGRVYVAPGGRHMEVKRGADGIHRIALNDMPAIGGLEALCQHYL
jgi:two-component system chemotaxis response regulator CheB